ncbi:hypothetical protein QYE76_025209 [Lolium multiflorum]|uniref:BHLH domain-containing protein n=1 Tax=Lolium multiflorum TaxID=4521 RepID=A0AAD8RGH7_LOLMU|nr:hypothetical protein QYE76_025209 [Lolium multiflorum]
MELFQGEEPAHDFLSLRAGGSSPFQRRLHSAQQVLKPLEPAKQGDSDGMEVAGDVAVITAEDFEEHVLPGGVGTFSIRQVTDAQLREASVAASMVEMAHAAGSGATVRGAPSTMWQDSGIDKRSRGSRAEGRSSGSSADQEPNSPRSKHSATEQRRRTKINDRLDVLRELLPNCNQKRDKASFLLEVIEYIRHLQDRCHKYESAVPDKNHVDAKSMPWDKVYYRSRWMSAQNISQVQGGGLSTTGENMNKEQHSSKSITAAPAPLFSTQSVRETSTTASSSHNITGSSMHSNQPPWLSMSTMNQNCDGSTRTLSKHEPPSHHNNSQSLSSAYSQGLLHKLKEALQKSGVDPSQANISVEINMDRRARADAHTDDNSKANEGKEPIHIAKRLRCD